MTLIVPFTRHYRRDREGNLDEMARFASLQCVTPAGDWWHAAGARMKGFWGNLQLPPPITFPSKLGGMSSSSSEEGNDEYGSDVSEEYERTKANLLGSDGDSEDGSTTGEEESDGDGAPSGSGSDSEDLPIEKKAKKLEVKTKKAAVAEAVEAQVRVGVEGWQGATSPWPPVVMTPAPLVCGAVPEGCPRF